MNYQDTINQIYQQYLGRAPSPAEMQGFTAAMQNNILDPIGLTQFLQSTAQYQQQQIPQYAQAMQGQLQGLQQQSTADTLKQGYDQAVGRYAQMGRPDSSGLGSSFAQVAQQAAAQNAGQTAQQVGGYLGNAYGGITGQQQGYGGNYNPNQQAYANYVNQSNLMNQQAQIGYNNIYAQAQNSMGGQQRGLLNQQYNLGYPQGAANIFGTFTRGLGVGR